MNPKEEKFIKIMIFYIFISYVLFPFALYKYYDGDLKKAGYGFLIGSIISMMLWVFYGSSMVE
jgi:hypothetical protein